MVSESRPAQLYFLYVNKHKIPDAFPTLEKAEEAAKPLMSSQPALQIKSTWGIFRTWNYRYDLKQWLEMT